MDFHIGFWLMMVICGGLFFIGGLFVSRIRRIEKIIDEKLAVTQALKEQR